MRKSDKFSQLLEITVEKIVPGGYGLAFAENLTIFVALAAVGDKLLVRIRERKGKTAFAEIVEIIKSAPERRAAPCEYFGRCGGCDFQQMTYEAQLAAKKAIVQDCLKRIGKIDYEREIEIVGSPEEFGYRARAQWHLDTRREKIGYFRRHSHDVIDVERCPILESNLQRKLTELRTDLNFAEFWAERAEIEAATDGGRVSMYAAEIVEPTDELCFAASGEKYFYNAENFFQGNLFLIEKLIDLATTGASGKFALDLFCGVGLFTLPLARKFERITGVEANANAIDYARRNAERARLDNAAFFAESTSEFLTDNQEKTAGADFILLDPPRAGAERETIEEIIKIAPQNISYVSCDPATFARDLRLLIAENYSIESIIAVDLFPQTHHVETVARLRRRSSYNL